MKIPHIKLAKICPQATRNVAIVDNTVTDSCKKRILFLSYSFPDLEFHDINASELQKDLDRPCRVFWISRFCYIYFVQVMIRMEMYMTSAESVQMLQPCPDIPVFSGIAIGMGQGLLGGK